MKGLLGRPHESREPELVFAVPRLSSSSHGEAHVGVVLELLPALRHAQTGCFRPHHAFLVSQLLAQLDFLEETIDQVSAQIAEVVTPLATDLDRLDAIPGVNRRTAEVIIAEIGVDMRQFPTAKHRPVSRSA